MSAPGLRSARVHRRNWQCPPGIRTLSNARSRLTRLLHRLTIVTVVLSFNAGCAVPRPPSSYPAFADNSRAPLAEAVVDQRESAMSLRDSVLNGPHTVNVYVDIALERNPRILAAQRLVAAQEQVIPQATALDDPMLSNSSMPITSNSLQTAAGRVPNTLTLSQKLPWLGKLRLRGEVAEQELKIALARLDEARLHIEEGVRLAYYDLYFNQRAIIITKESKALLDDLLHIAEARYQTGQTSQQDVLKAQVELDRLDDRLIDLSRALAFAQVDLARLLHTDPHVRPEAIAELVPSRPPTEPEVLYERASRCRPELQARQASIAQAERREELARLEYFPDVTLGIGWQSVTPDGAIAGMATGNDNLMFMASMNLPIWRERLRAGVGEAHQRAIESALRYDASHDDTIRQVSRQLIQAHASEDQMRLLRENIIPRHDQTLHVSIADYRVGRIDFLSLIDNWTQLLTLQVQLARLEANLEQSLASLERAVGCALDSSDAAPPVPAGVADDPVDNAPERKHYDDRAATE
jgi:outer membrane protein, heavy metal efflux system